MLPEIGEVSKVIFTPFSMPYSFQVFEQLSELTSVMQFPVLRHCESAEVIEKSQPADLQNYYLVISENEKQVALFYFQWLKVKPYHFNISNKKFQQVALSLALKLVRPTLLVAGNLFRHDMLFYEFFEENISEERKTELYRVATQKMIEHTNASGIFLKDVEKKIAEAIIQDKTYTRMPEDISMEMRIPSAWQTFADYEHALKHKYAQRCRKIRGTAQEISIVELEQKEIEHYASEIHRLYMQVVSKQMVSMGVLTASFFVEMKKSLKQKFRVFGFFQGENLVAFSSAIQHDQDYDMNYIGFDYERNQELNLYFNILFHCVETAIQSKAGKLILGRTAIEAKAILGCEPDYRYSFYKLRNVVVNWFYQMVSKYFQEQQGEKWKERHPFKSNYYGG